MDRSNLSGLQRLGAAADGQLVLFRSFDEVSASPDVPDPWGHGMDAFAEVYDILDRTMPRLLAYARERSAAG